MGRMEKVNEQIRREIGNILQKDIADPRLQFVTITNASVSPDLKNARIYFSVLGDQKKIDDAIKAFNKAKGMIRKLVGSRILMRYTPELHFSYDDSILFSIKMEETLKDLKNEE